MDDRRPPPELRLALWDLALDSLDIERDAESILARVLENGGSREVRAAIRLYGLERIRRFFREVAHPIVSERTRAFWRAFFRAQGEPWPTPPSWRRSSAAPWID